MGDLAAPGESHLSEIEAIRPHRLSHAGRVKSRRRQAGDGNMAAGSDLNRTGFQSVESENAFLTLRYLITF
jgi:hypothetical protein